MNLGKCASVNVSFLLGDFEFFRDCVAEILFVKPLFLRTYHMYKMISHVELGIRCNTDDRANMATGLGTIISGHLNEQLGLAGITLLQPPPLSLSLHQKMPRLFLIIRLCGTLP